MWKVESGKWKVEFFKNLECGKWKTEGTSATAGYTVPQDISTAIHSYKTNRFSFEPYVRKETVNTKSGSRVYRKRNTTAAFSQVNEGLISGGKILTRTATPMPW